MDFIEVKRRILEGKDLSIKGSVDEYIVDLIAFINNQEEYVTTSSCSGRTVVVARAVQTMEESSKKSCQWLFSSHGTFEPDNLIEAVSPSAGEVILKFEPFILHVLCCDMEAADVLVKTAYNAGFRESGVLPSGDGRAMVAVRTNTQLAVPICSDSKLLVTNEYLHFLAKSALAKLTANNDKIDKFFAALKERLEFPKSKKKQKNMRKKPS